MQIQNENLKKNASLFENLFLFLRYFRRWHHAAIIATFHVGLSGKTRGYRYITAVPLASCSLVDCLCEYLLFRLYKTASPPPYS